MGQVVLQRQVTSSNWMCSAATRQSPYAMQIFNQHPKRPSQARIDDLAEPWTDSYSSQAPEE